MNNFPERPSHGPISQAQPDQLLTILPIFGLQFCLHGGKFSPHDLKQKLFRLQLQMCARQQEYDALSCPLLADPRRLETPLPHGILHHYHLLLLRLCHLMSDLYYDLLEKFKIFLKITTPLY